MTVILSCTVISAHGQIVDVEKKTKESETKIKSHTTDTLEGWKSGGIVNMNVSQASFSNWAAGGQNSVSFNGLGSLYARYRSGNISWDNTLDISYGLLQQGPSKRWMKTDDRFEYGGKFGYRASGHWNYALLLELRSQMAPGYLPSDMTQKISDFLAPAYLLAAAGIDYRQGQTFSMLIAPFTGKTTIVNDTRLADGGSFGVKAARYDASGKLVEHGEKVRNEFGGYIKMVLRKDNILTNINLVSKLDLFSNYGNHPGNIDINWETLITLKVNRFISATISAMLIYDDDIKTAGPDGSVKGPRIQFKEVTGIGFSYRFDGK
jgi:hypothetical protein